MIVTFHTIWQATSGEHAYLSSDITQIEMRLFHQLRQFMKLNGTSQSGLCPASRRPWDRTGLVVLLTGHRFE